MSTALLPTAAITSSSSTTVITSTTAAATSSAATTTTTTATAIAAVIVTAGGCATLDFFDVLAGEHRVVEFDTAEEHRLMDVFGLRKFEKEAHRAIIFDIRHRTDAKRVVMSATGDVRGVFFDNAGETL